MLKEISLFLPNKAGELSKVLKVLCVVNIQAYSIEQGDKFSTLRLITSDPNAARYQLTSHG